MLRIPAILAEEAFNQELPVSNFVAKVAEWRGHLRAERLILSKVGDPWGSVLLELALLGRSIVCSSSHLPGVMVGSALRVPLKQLPLSGYLGVSRSLLSGCFRALRAEGWLEVGYGSFDLLKPKVQGALYSRQVQDRSGFYQMTMPELMLTMQQLEGEIYA